MSGLFWIKINNEKSQKNVSEFNISLSSFPYQRQQGKTPRSALITLEPYELCSILIHMNYGYASRYFPFPGRGGLPLCKHSQLHVQQYLFQYAGTVQVECHLLCVKSNLHRFFLIPFVIVETRYNKNGKSLTEQQKSAKETIKHIK